MGDLIVLEPQSGDRRVPWDPQDPDQVAQARAKFDALRGEGYRAYRVGRRGQAAQELIEFDPSAAEILFTGRGGYVGG